MKHIGDISQVHGWDLEPVDIIVGGSPCQDLSVAGKRKGLLHVEKGDEETSRSGLFHEQIRIIKEMRDYERNVRKRPTELIRPRFCIWENVPGAFSSNKGEDFRIVLEEFGKIADPTFSVPRPENGKWEPSGLIVGNGFNIAWRTHSAEFWCVPQRRKRISVVIDFGSERTGEISFERKSLFGHLKTSKPKRKDPSTEAADGIGTASESYTLKIRGGAATDSNGRTAGKGPLVQRELSGTLGVSQDQTLFQFNDVECVALHEAEGQDMTFSDVAYALTTGGGKVGQGYPVILEDIPVERERERSEPMTYDARGNGDGCTVCTITGDHNGHVSDYTALVIEDDSIRNR